MKLTLNNISKINGNDLTLFAESLGCNTRNHVGEHKVLWSVFTGNFFVIPIYNKEVLDPLAIKHIVWQLGLTESSFINLWEDFYQ